MIVVIFNCKCNCRKFKINNVSKYISLNETEIIVNDLLRNALIDYIDEANLQLINYMGEYINF